jgi:hypothetical protein
VECFFARADLGGDAVQFVVKDVAEALREDEGKDVVLIFRGIYRAVDGTGGVPDPGFEGFVGEAPAGRKGDEGVAATKIGGGVVL